LDRSAAFGGGPFIVVGIAELPVAVIVFPAEIYSAQRRRGDRTFGNLIYWNGVDKDGHLSAMCSRATPTARRTQTLPRMQRSSPASTRTESSVAAWGHNLPQEAPGAFADAVIEVDSY
jgi:hypothetical protein